MKPNPKRGWVRFAFSLRVPFVVVTVFAVWLAYELNWIRQRHEFLGTQSRLAAQHAWVRSNGTLLPKPVSAPGLLWLFGEKGEPAVEIIIMDDYSSELRRAHRLFPEAILQCLQPNGDGSFMTIGP